MSADTPPTAGEVELATIVADMMRAVEADRAQQTKDSRRFALDYEARVRKRLGQIEAARQPKLFG